MHFEFSDKVKDLQKRLTAFMDEYIYPNEPRYHEHTNGPDRWQPVPVIEELKPKARAARLWNLFLPDSEHGRHFNEGQMELRVNALKTAYKFARQLVVEVAKPS